MPHRFPNLCLVRHPLIAHKLSFIRDRHTNTRDFRRLLSEIAALMTYEVFREFGTTACEVETPLERTAAERIITPITIVPVLRAGLGMTRGVLDLVPEARVGHIGIRRDESTALPIGYYTKLPVDVASGPVILVDPMLATGGSSSHALSILRGAGCMDLRLICLVASPEGVGRLLADHPGVRVYAAALDRELDSNKFIRPGLGDAGDRTYGTD
jgi:uracil phosphoribosyltransferase